MKYLLDHLHKKPFLTWEGGTNELTRILYAMLEQAVQDGYTMLTVTGQAITLKHGERERVLPFGIQEDFTFKQYLKRMVHNDRQLQPHMRLVTDTELTYKIIAESEGTT